MLIECTNSKVLLQFNLNCNISSKCCLARHSNIVSFSFCDVFVTKEVPVTVRCSAIIRKNILCSQLEIRVLENLYLWLGAW